MEKTDEQVVEMNVDDAKALKKFKRNERPPQKAFSKGAKSNKGSMRKVERKAKRG